MRRIFRKKRKNKKRYKPDGYSNQRLPENETVAQGDLCQDRQTTEILTKDAIDSRTRKKSRFQQSDFTADVHALYAKEKNKNKSIDKKKGNIIKRDLYQAYQGLGTARQRPDTEILPADPYCMYTNSDVHLTSALIEIFNNFTDYQINYKVNNNKELTERDESNQEDDKKKELYHIYGIGETIQEEQFNIKVLKRIGEGSQAIIYQVKNRSDIMAGKIAKTEAFNHFLKQEFDLLSSLHHPNILSVHQPVNHGYLMEIMPDTLLDYIDRIKPCRIPLNFRNTATLGILRAVSYIHDVGIAHLDLKVENILLTSGGQPKLADFGMSVRFKNADGSTMLLKGKRGTLPYMSPELLSKRPKKQMAPIDAWATGVVLYIIFTDGLYPFGNLSPRDVLAKQLRTPLGLPSALCELVKYDPSYMAYYKLICKLLTYNPQQRLTIKTALSIFENSQRNLMC